ncbi:MAG: amidase [Pseudomonadota bacterium]
MEDTVNAFIDIFALEGSAGGPLSGLTFASKDLYDIAGHVTGCGNPDWARTHPPAETHAPPVEMLLAAGATLAGKSHTDELAYSLMGANSHYGTPVNSGDPRRVPGGSSSGSAAAVAAELVDIGLGSDTGGSVRLPASFCGVWGIRPTHGVIAIDRTMPLAPSFDTAGWFARDPATLVRAGHAFGMTADASLPQTLLLPVDAWARADARTVLALGQQLHRLQTLIGPVRPIVLAPDGLDQWREAFRIHQAHEVWQVHGDWVTATNPDFGPGIRDRFAMARSITDEEFAWSVEARKQVNARIQELSLDTAIMVLPTAPGPAPLRETPHSDLDEYRTRALELLCTAGLGGLPQISMPAGPSGELEDVATPGKVDGGPVGLSIVGGRGKDGMLLAVAERLAQ